MPQSAALALEQIECQGARRCHWDSSTTGFGRRCHTSSVPCLVFKGLKGPLLIYIQAGGNSTPRPLAAALSSGVALHSPTEASASVHRSSKGLNILNERCRRHTTHRGHVAVKNIAFGYSRYLFLLFLPSKIDVLGHPPKHTAAWNSRPRCSLAWAWDNPLARHRGNA